MVSEQFHVQRLPNGLTLLGQSMPDVSSAAMTIAVPAGAAFDPADAPGTASVIAEWSLRGAGGRDTHALNDALDSLGCQHHASVISQFIQYSAVQLGRNLTGVLEILADILRRPTLDASTFPSARSLILQDLEALEDEPARKAMMLVRERFYPSPLGRCVYGTAESLQSMSEPAVAAHARAGLSPRDAIISVAGNIDWNAFCGEARRLFEDWEADGRPSPQLQPAAGGVRHLGKDSAQVHITLAHKATCVSEDCYYAARLAETVLSGGMSSRLFTEVREKRGLVYHVSTQYHSLKDHAGMFTYAGTVPDKAQETLEVTVRELKRLVEGIEPGEMERAKTQYKSSTIMQGESTAARSAALAGDWYHLKRLRSLDEIARAIDEATIDDVLAYLARYPADGFSVLTIGPEPLDTAAAGI